MLLIHFGIVLRAFGTDRRLNDMHQSRFVRLDALAEGVEIQGGHKFILVRSRLTLSGRHTAVRSPAGQGYPAVCQGRVGLAEQGVFVHAQRVIRQKMNIVDAEFIGSEVGNGGDGGFIRVEARISGTRMVIVFRRRPCVSGCPDALSRTVRPLLENVSVDMLQVGEEQIDVR